tara:strand:- start:9222 stop:10415 length:1194 start_codon:yes stop_codon:yes gene_type:complete
MKILHIVYQSLPNISGSSIRTRDILMSQKEIGLNPVVLSSPFQNGLSKSETDIIHGVKHYRSYDNKPQFLVTETKTPLYKRIIKALAIILFYKKAKKVVQTEKPDIIHAHATFFCAIVAIALGKQFNIPVCYEVRSLWEEREKKSATSFIAKIQPKIIYFLETKCMKKADKVIVINKNLKKEILSRGVRNIEIIPNAVNIGLLKNSELANPREELTFGYIGSISPIEGLDLIVKVWSKLEIEGLKNKFHVFGNGSFLNELKALTVSLGVKQIIFHGNIDPNQVFKAFNQVDVIINPRTKSRISDTVTPLKPLEAMAYKKLVIASDVGGMKELVQDQKTGLLFKSGSINELENIVLSVIKNGLNQQIINCAYNNVCEEKSWTSNAQKYNVIYEKLLNS